MASGCQAGLGWLILLAPPMRWCSTGFDTRTLINELTSLPSISWPRRDRSRCKKRSPARRLVTDIQSTYRVLTRD